MFGNKENKQNKRFEVIHSEGSIEGSRILRDKRTGVNYLFTYSGSAGGLTVLLDSDGKPIVTIEELDYK